MKERRRDERALAGAQRDLLEQAGDRVQRLGLAAPRALRRSRRAAREDDEPAASLRRDDGAAVAGGDELLERLGAVIVALSPCEQPPPAAGRLVQGPGELLVVDDRGGRLALADLGELRGGERRVEEQGVRAELRAGDRRLSACASAFVRRSASSNVSAPSSSMIATASGWRIAAAVRPAAGVGPQRLTAMSARASLSGRVGANIRDSSSVRAVRAFVASASRRMGAKSRGDAGPKGGFRGR
jgi:hypothetical protein